MLRKKVNIVVINIDNCTFFGKTYIIARNNDNCSNAPRFYNCICWRRYAYAESIVMIFRINKLLANGSICYVIASPAHFGCIIFVVVVFHSSPDYASIETIFDIADYRKNLEFNNLLPCIFKSIMPPRYRNM